MTHEEKTKKIIDAWLDYIKIDDLASATVEGKCILEGGITIKENGLFLEQNF